MNVIPEHLLQPGLKDLIDLCPDAAKEVITAEVKRLISEYAVRTLLNYLMDMTEEIKETHEQLMSMGHHACYLVQVERERQEHGEPSWREDPHELL